MTDDRQNPSAIIIGAGMTGILLAIKLREAGITRVTVLEKAASQGGTWRENTYPGVACDVPSHAYTYSFESNPEWSNHFPPGSEIYGYFKRIFYKYGVDGYTRFNEKVTSCRFADSRWCVETQAGNSYRADLLFSATGILHQPVTPDIAGLDAFKGPHFHTARWDHSVDMRGKRIGVIGTGSSATQVIPQLIDMDRTEVRVFQRTPQWIVSMKDRAFSDAEKKRFRRQPSRMKLIRKLSAIVYSQGTAALTGDSRADRLKHRLMSLNARRNLDKSVRDPILRAKLTPDYKLGCKRVVINSNFYDAIQKPNAQLVTEGIDHIDATGIVTADGRHHALDAIVYATGFDASAFMRPMRFTGRDGVSIEQAWARKPQAYRSMLLPDFPNFFLMLGPNSPIGNQSVIEISERQVDYALQLIKAWQQGKLDEIEVTQSASQRWNAMLKSRMGKTVWTSGCNSWYLDAEGDALAWPDNWNNWIAAMRAPDFDDFVAPAAATGEPEADAPLAAVAG